jgi:hypothetical protein
MWMEWKGKIKGETWKQDDTGTCRKWKEISEIIYVSKSKCYMFTSCLDFSAPLWFASQKPNR